MASSPKIIVFDDDPTGSQTVRGCPLLLEFSTASLQAGLADPSPLMFLLTNTRALEPEQVRQQLTVICQRLKPLLAQLARPWLVVSRGDSTLRGHTPLELEVIRSELGPFVANLLVPAFPQGGRTTEAGVHLLYGEPLHHSPFARDRRFGYASSDLPQWLEHRTAGAVSADSVARLKPADSLAELELGKWAVLDARTQNDLDRIGEQVLSELDFGRKHLCQSAASLINGLSGVPSVLLGTDELPFFDTPGLVVVGSFIPLSDVQLKALLCEPACRGIEFSIHASDSDISDLTLILEKTLASGFTPVLFTSRGERTYLNALEQIRLASRMARSIAPIKDSLPYLISKGGTTSMAILRECYRFSRVYLLGQLQYGLSVTQPYSLNYQNRKPLVVTFPGNLGDKDSLRKCWKQINHLI